MYIAIRLTMFDQTRIMLGPFSPPGILGVPIDDPEHASKETFAPVSPRFGVMLPFALYGIQREIVGVLSNQMAQLPPRKLQRGLGSLIKRVCRLGVHGKIS